MAKLSNEEFKQKSLQSLEKYVDEHPSEGARASKLCAKTAGHCIDQYINYQIDRVKSAAKPQNDNLVTDN